MRLSFQNHSLSPSNYTHLGSKNSAKFFLFTKILLDLIDCQFDYENLFNHSLNHKSY